MLTNLCSIPYHIQHSTLYTTSCPSPPSPFLTHPSLQPSCLQGNSEKKDKKEKEQKAKEVITYDIPTPPGSKKGEPWAIMAYGCTAHSLHTWEQVGQGTWLDVTWARLNVPYGIHGA